MVIIKSLKTNTILTLLNLQNNSLGDATMEFLSEALETNRALVELILSDNDIGDKGARFISKPL